MEGYKDTDIKWVEKIPYDWSVKRLKEIGSIKYGLGQPPKLLDGGLPLIRATNVHRGKIDTNDLIFVDPDDIPYDRDPILLADDIIVVRSGAYTADSAIIPKEYEGSITGYDMVFRSNKNISPKFISYCLLTDYVLENQLKIMSLRAAQPHLNREELGQAKIVFPPLPEQKLIAAYLNKTAGTIDNAIAIKKQQLVKLEELKKSVIYNAVTKGLDDSVKYKDSGVEWIGKIPDHWTLAKLKNHCQVIPSSVDKKIEENEFEVELCNYTDVYYNRYIKSNFDFMKATASEAEIKKFQLRVNDVIITKDSEDPNDIAVPAIVKDTKDNLLCGYHLSIIRCDKMLVSSYLFWCMYDSSIVSQFHREATGITRWAIANKHVKNGIIPIPPIYEQNEIHNFIHKKMDELDITVNKIESQIQKLEDYKKSLIHECVTGKRRITEKDIYETVLS